MDRWYVYELLKNGKEVDLEVIRNISAEEVKEGVIEFLLHIQRSSNE